MMVDREKTGPDKISSRAIQAIRQTLTDGFCPGTTPRNYQRYEDLLKSLGRLPSLDEIGGEVDLESGYISVRGIFSVVRNGDKQDVEDALIKRLLMDRGELYCHEDILWSMQTLKYGGNESHILRTTPEGKISILQINELDDKEILVSMVDPKDIRRVALRGTGEYQVDENGKIFQFIGEQKYSPQVKVSRLLAGQTVTRINIMGAPYAAVITDVVVIGPDNQLLERTIDWTFPHTRSKTYYAS